MNQFIKTGLIFIVHCLFIVISSNAQNKITSYQYWFDNEYNTNEIVIVTPAEEMNLLTMLRIENLNGVLNIFSIHFQDSSGKWSVPVDQYFYSSKTMSQENTITGYHYWLNEDIENARYISINDPAQLLNLNEDLDFSDLTNGEYVIHFQFKDISGKWSLVTSDNFTYIRTSSIESTFEETINVYPNPTSGLIRIISDHEFTPECTFEICDYLGRIVLLKKLINERSQAIDLSQLPKGIYYIRIKDTNSYFYQKILLQ